jgi:hypothetical protein
MPPGQFAWQIFDSEIIPMWRQLSWPAGVTNLSLSGLRERSIRVSNGSGMGNYEPNEGRDS